MPKKLAQKLANIDTFYLLRYTPLVTKWLNYT
jgi:hypothetical protein